MIVCVRFPDLPIALARRAMPALGSRPVIVASESAGRVLARSSEAAQAGVELGMRLGFARALCPAACVVPPDQEAERAVLMGLVDLLRLLSSRVEAGAYPWRVPSVRSPGGPSYPLARGLHGAAWGLAEVTMRAVGEAIDMVQDLGAAIRSQLGLLPAVSLADGVFVAQLAATLAGNDQSLFVPRERTNAFLTAQSIELLALERELSRRLRLLGLTTFGRLAALPELELLSRLGPQAALLHRLATGREDRPLLPLPPLATVRARRRFEGTVSDLRVVVQAAHGLIAELMASVRARGLAARALTLTLTLEDGSVRSADRALPLPSARAEPLLHAGTALVSALQPSCGVETVSVTLGDLSPLSAQQLSLFALQGGQERRLRLLLPDLASRFGAASFCRARLADPDTPVPEWRVRIEPETEE